MVEQLARLIHDPHRIGGDLIDDHDLTVDQTDLDLHVDQHQSLATQIGLDNAADLTGKLLGLSQMLGAEQAQGQDGVIIDQRVTALVILDGDLDQIVQTPLGVADVIAVATQEAAPGTGAADELETASALHVLDRKSTRLNSSHVRISYAVFCLKK